MSRITDEVFVTFGKLYGLIEQLPKPNHSSILWLLDHKTKEAQFYMHEYMSVIQRENPGASAEESER